MPRIFRRKSFAEEHVAEVTAAASALNLDALAVRVWQTPHGAGDLIIEGWPPAMSVELVFGPVE